MSRQFHTRPVWTTKPLIIWIVLGLLLLTSSIVLAEVSVPQTDQTPLSPLPIPNPAAVDPRYLSGYGTDNAYTIFFEDRSDTAGCLTPGYRIKFVETSNGPANFSAPQLTDVCDTHFVVKDWPITIGPTTYGYRAWGSGSNNGDHNFYVSTNRINWVRNPLSGVPFNFTGSPTVLYGFHDVVQINGNYMGFAETATSRTVIVWSDLGTNIWNVVAIVGGSGVGPLDLNVGGSGPTPTGSFVLMEVGGQQVYGKLGVPGDNSDAFLAINRVAAQASTSAAAESAFLDPTNWSWSDGSTGIPDADSLVLAGSAAHDVREVWTIPMSNTRSDHVFFYTARYGGGSDFGCAASNPECLVLDPPPIDTPPSKLPSTGFPKRKNANILTSPLTSPIQTSGMTLEIPDLKIQMPLVGVPQSADGWDVTWLGNNAGYLAGSAFPTWSGNTVITGHVWNAYNQPGPFSEIKSLSFGDEVLIHAWGKTYHYEVREKKLLFPSQSETAFTHEEYDWITLITCEFFNPITDEYLFRRSVKAVLVEVK